MAPRAVAYLRRSSPDERDGAGEASKSVQEQAVRDAARRYGVTLADADVFTDWGRSADESKVARRRAYARMLHLVESGQVSHLFAYALDRLNRSTALSARLARAVEEHGVILATQREGEVKTDSPAEWLKWQMLATFGEYDLRVMKARAKSNIAMRRARGDDFGYAPFGFRVNTETHRLEPRADEDLSAIVEAYERAGSFGGAARLLNTDADLMARARPRRSEWWSENTVARILRRYGHASGKTSKGWSPSRAPEDFALYRLLVCPVDGNRLTAMRTTSGNGKKFTRYICSAARRDPTHPRPYAVAESYVLPWLKEQAETASIAKPDAQVTVLDPAVRRAELEEDRRRLGVSFQARAITDDEFLAAVAAIDDEIAHLPARPFTMKGWPGRKSRIRWDADPAELGKDLREVVESIALDESMRPVEVTWR